MSWDESADYSTDVVVPKWNFGKLIAVPGGSGPPGPKGDTGDVGPVGPQGERGEQGPATVSVGSTTTGEPGSEAAVTNVGTGQDVVLEFTVPRGEPAPASVRQFPSLAQFPATGASDNIYIAADTGHTYRWDGSKYVGIHDAVLASEKNVFTGKVEWNNSTPVRAVDGVEEDRDERGLFVNSFDSTVWIAPSPRVDPTVQSQGLYVQHRVDGDLGAKVHDAAASELRISNATNTTSLAAHENSLVVTGGTNNIGTMIGTLSNFHTTGTPTGTANELMIIRAQQAFNVPPTFTIDSVYSLYVDSQIAGQKNFSLYVAGGDSVIRGKIVPATGAAATDTGLLVAARPDSEAGQILFGIAGPLTQGLWRLKADGTGGHGPDTAATAGAAWFVNSGAHPDKVALKVVQSGSQTANPFEVTSSAGTMLAGIATNGAVYTTMLVTPTTNTNQNINLRTYGTGVTTTNSVQVEVKGHTHTAADIVGAEKTSNKGIANGYAPLDATSKVPTANLPARWVTAPATASSPGTAGDVAYDATHMYVCVAANTWKSIAYDATWKAP